MLFLDNDPQWKGADSSIFMLEAVKVMEARGYRVGNLDVALMLQKPKVDGLRGGHEEEHCELAQDNTENCVNVKARTHKKVDSVGECKSYECHVVITLERN